MKSLYERAAHAHSTNQETVGRATNGNGPEMQPSEPSRAETRMGNVAQASRERNRFGKPEAMPSPEDRERFFQTLEANADADGFVEADVAWRALDDALPARRTTSLRLLATRRPTVRRASRAPRRAARARHVTRTASTTRSGPSSDGPPSSDDDEPDAREVRS